MTRIIITGRHGRFAAMAVAALLRDAAAVEIGSGTITMEVNEPDLPAFNWPSSAVAPPRHSGRRTAQWKQETRGRRS